MGFGHENVQSTRNALCSLYGCPALQRLGKSLPLQASANLPIATPLPKYWARATGQPSSPISSQSDGKASAALIGGLHAGFCPNGISANVKCDNHNRRMLQAVATRRAGATKNGYPNRETYRQSI